MVIADFIIEKMSAYISGGMKPETAAHFTRGELESIYKGNHYSRDKSGAMRTTPPPEVLGIEAAMKKAETIITELLNSIKTEAGQNMAHNATDKGEPSGTAPEITPEMAQANSLKGFEELADYRGDWWTKY